MSTDRTIVRKSNCIAVHEDGLVIGTFAGPDCEEHAAQFAALLPPVPMTEEEIREGFEKRLLSGIVEPDLQRTGSRYTNKAVQQRWIGWQAAYERLFPLAGATTEMTGEEAYHKAAAEYETAQIRDRKPGNSYPKFCHLSPQEQAFWVAKITSKRGGA